MEVTKDSVEDVKKKSIGFFKTMLLDQGDSPSSKRFLAIVSAVLGMVAGFVFGSVLVVLLFNNALLVVINENLPYLTQVAEYVKWFVTVLFTLAGTLLGFSMAEWFSTKK